MTVTAIQVSVVVTVAERPEPLAEFIAEYAAAVQHAGYVAEFVVVADPGYRELLGSLAGLAENGGSIRMFEAAQTIGETGLLRAALPFCRGEIIVILPAYRRVMAAGIAPLIDCVRDGAAMATARRVSPSDSWRNRLRRRAFNLLGRQLIGGEFLDLSSGVRAVRLDALRELPVYGDFLRFLPAFARRDGFRVEEVTVPQHVDDLRPRTYSLGIYLRRLIDLMAVFFLVRFREKPLRFFGLIGAALAGAGLLILASLLVTRLGGEPIGDRPLLVLGVLLLVLGVQGVALGLVGEIIVFAGSRQRKPYRLTSVALARATSVVPVMPSHEPASVDVQ
jgi:hypothetical protein